jgi:hypothetical protein
MRAKRAIQPEPRVDEISELIETFDEVLAAEGRSSAAKLSPLMRCRNPAES